MTPPNNSTLWMTLAVVVLLHVAFLALLYEGMTRIPHGVVIYTILWISYALVVRNVAAVRRIAAAFTGWRGYWLYSVLFHLLAIAEAGICFIIFGASVWVGCVAVIGLLFGYSVSPLFVFGRRPARQS